MNTQRLLVTMAIATAAYTFFFNSSYADDSCAKVAFKPAEKCENISATFDLSGCSNSKEAPKLAKTTCSGDKGTITYRSDNYEYLALIRPYIGSSNAVVWDLEGTVTRTKVTKKVVAQQVEQEASKKAIAPEVEPTKAPPIAAITPPAVAASPAPAPITPLAFSTAARMRTETSNKTDLTSNRSFTVFRVRPDVTFRPIAEASVFFQPQFAKTLGEGTFTGTSTTANTAQDTSGTTYDTALSIHQAYIDLGPTSWMSILLGRLILSYGTEMILGALEWNNIGRSFDGAKVTLSHAKGWVDFFGTKVQENNSTAAATIGDKDFYGIHNNLNLSPWVKTVETYAFYLKDNTSRINAVSPSRLTSSHLWTAGVRLQSNIEWLDYQVEATKQWTKYTDVEGIPSQAFQVDGEIGVTAPISQKPRISLEGFYSTKDFNQLFPTAHKFLGYADVFGRRNISGLVVHSRVNLLDSVKFMADYHYFLRTDLEAPVYKLNGTTAIGSVTRTTSAQLGSELDLTTSWQINKHVGLSGGVALVWPGTYIKEQFGFENLNFYYGQIDFKL